MAEAGRPSLYSVEIAETICNRIADGEGLRAICRDDAMPGRQTVLDWLNDDGKADFRAKYARARENQGDYLDEEMQAVADKATAETVQVAKLRVETMKWRASKLAPKKYGDRTVHAGDPEQPLIPAATDERELAKAIVAALAGAAKGDEPASE